MPAVTVALWGLVFADDAPRRAREQSWRRTRVARALTVDHGLDGAAAERIWGSAVSTFRTARADEHHTPGIAYCLGEALAAAGLRPGPSFDELVADLETRALIDPPELLPGALATLATLSTRWSVGVVADALVTPAPVLRELLHRADVSRYVDAAVFSDELGAAKPASLPFRVVAEDLGVRVDELIHAGPSEARDVSGALAAGAAAIRLGPPPTAANAWCERVEEIPSRVDAILASWES